MRTTSVCRYCSGTGFYSGPLLNWNYAGPCIMCDPEEENDDYNS